MKEIYKTKNFWAAYGAALWAIIFALMHLAWAFGWYLGLDKTAADKAFERKWFLIYDIIAVVLCGAAAAVALALASSDGRRLSRLSPLALGWCCAGILMLRGGAAIIWAIYKSIHGGNLAADFSFWDFWFCLGAFLFGASVWRFQSENRKS